MTSEEKNEIKKRNEMFSKEFQTCILDGTLEKIGNFWIEPRSIFKGRGKHPKSGMTKDSTMPEDIVINIDKKFLVPVCSIPGRSWQSVVHRKDAFWIASWVEPI
jgi:DNA topoisomerase-1